MGQKRVLWLRRLACCRGGDAKGGHTAHNAKDVLIADGGNFALCPVGALGDAVEEDMLASRLEDLLVAGLESGDHIAQDSSGGC